MEAGKTAFQAMQEERIESVARNRLNRDVLDFIDRWQPKDDPHEAATFNAELNMLVRSIYMDMQTPIREAARAAAEANITASRIETIIRSAREGGVL